MKNLSLLLLLGIAGGMHAMNVEDNLSPLTPSQFEILNNLHSLTSQFGEAIKEIPCDLDKGVSLLDQLMEQAKNNLSNKKDRQKIVPLLSKCTFMLIKPVLDSMEATTMVDTEN